jgi:hypothetical protein
MFRNMMLGGKNVDFVNKLKEGVFIKELGKFMLIVVSPAMIWGKDLICNPLIFKELMKFHLMKSFLWVSILLKPKVFIF